VVPTSGTSNRALKVHFVEGPQVDACLRHQRLEFFLALLPFRVSPSNRRPRFAQAETQLPEHTLTLAHSQADAILPLDQSGQGFAIPQIAAQT
jgi:hypothetical protein